MATASKQSDFTIESQTLDNHLASIRREIILLALQEHNVSDASANSSDVPSEAAIWKAALRLAPGRPYPENLSWFDRLYNGFGNSTALLAWLTLAFALMGLVGTGAIPIGHPVGASTAQSLTPFLDIAKIFAGAIVGSATATAGIRAKRS